jgi:hypothetical protein
MGKGARNLIPSNCKNPPQPSGHGRPKDKGSSPPSSVLSRRRGRGDRRRRRRAHYFCQLNVHVHASIDDDDFEESLNIATRIQHSTLSSVSIPYFVFLFIFHIHYDYLSSAMHVQSLLVDATVNKTHAQTQNNNTRPLFLPPLEDCCCIWRERDPFQWASAVCVYTDSRASDSLL